MATIPPARGIRRVAVYVELGDGEKILYDFQEIRDGIYVHTEHDPEVSIWPRDPLFARGLDIRTNIAFELRDVGPYTMYKPQPGQNPFAPKQPEIGPLEAEIED